MTEKTVLLIVAHPDDEVIWALGWVSCFQDMGYTVCCLCLSGQDSLSPREQEFARASESMGIRGLVLGTPLLHAETLHTDLVKKTEEGIRRLAIKKESLRMVVTHSPYGDEHLHPHHMQIFREVRKFTRKAAIPFAFVSQILPPVYKFVPRSSPFLIRFQRTSIIGVLNCSFRYMYYAYYYSRKTRHFPFFSKYVAMLSYSSEEKRKTLRDCYPSIDPDMHIDGYHSLSSNLEYLFFDDDHFRRELERSDRQGIDGHSLFEEMTIFSRAVRKLIQRMGGLHALHAQKEKP
ncbi:MAG: PIG-L family deacetylase [Deltaproteobacteria bacterium]|nr:PIG-L family deacetylase [Deltaproteobacteria bacterium]